MSYYDKDPFAEYKTEKKIPDWIGHPEKHPATEVEKDIAENLKNWEVLYVDSMDDPSYEFDDIALLQRNDGLFALLRTSGCSCPSPNENWGEEVSGTLEEVYKKLNDSIKAWGHYENERQNHDRRMLKVIEQILTERDV